jgi:hypothetical protein
MKVRAADIRERFVDIQFWVLSLLYEATLLLCNLVAHYHVEV